MAHYNFINSNPIWVNYNIFVYLCEETLDDDLCEKLRKNLDYNSFNGYPTVDDENREWLYNGDPEKFLKRTRSIVESSKNMKYNEIPSLDWESVVEELQTCIDGLRKACLKLNFRRTIFVNSFCLKLANLQQLVMSIKCDDSVLVNESNPFDVLPDVVMVRIFNNFSIEERKAIELVSTRWCHLSRASWGFLTCLSYYDYDIISNLLEPKENDWFVMNSQQKRKEYERRLLEIIGRMCHWKTNLVNIHLNLHRLIGSVSNDTLRKRFNYLVQMFGFCQ